MPEDKELLERAKSSQEDFYELLGVEFESSEADIKRAYRKTSLKYHPDKHPGNLEVVEKFHLLAIARKSPTFNSLYPPANMPQVMSFLTPQPNPPMMPLDFEKRNGNSRTSF